MKILKESVGKILVISLSNLGDIVLTFPVIDILRRDFDQADLSVMVGPKGKPLLIDNPRIDHLYVYDKSMPLKNKIRWVSQLRKERFDLVVDLRHNCFPVFLMPRYRTPLLRRKVPLEHARDRHLRVLYAIHPAELSRERFSFFSSEEDQKVLNAHLAGRLSDDDRYVVLAPGAANSQKRWTEEGFAQAADYLAQEQGLKVVFVGDEMDARIVSRITARMRISAIDLSGRASLTQVGRLLSQASLAVVNDSFMMHLASYLGTPVVALFGPSDPGCYGPWGDWSGFIRRNQECVGCQMGGYDVEHTCMAAISVADVTEMSRRLLNSKF